LSRKGLVGSFKTGLDSKGVLTIGVFVTDNHSVSHVIYLYHTIAQIIRKIIVQIIQGIIPIQATGISFSITNFVISFGTYLSRSTIIDSFHIV
jgi:hypothetical protein